MLFPFFLSGVFSGEPAVSFRGWYLVFWGKSFSYCTFTIICLKQIWSCFPAFLQMICYESIQWSCKGTSACGYTFWDIRGFFCLHNASQDFFEPQLKIWRSNNIIALGDFDFDFCSRPHFLKVQNQLEHSSVNHLGPKDFGTSIETHVAYFWHAIKSLACGVVSELYSSNESNIIAMAKMVQPLWCCVFHSKESRLSCWNR